VLALQVGGMDVTTIEGLASPDGEMHPMQAAFKECHGLQCGFCTPGMVMSACELAGRMKDPTDADIRGAFDGNLCRCTGYQNIVKSVQTGLAGMANRAGN
jgi:carbon-monoxide dehydrogenase small subunit